MQNSKDEFVTVPLSKKDGNEKAEKIPYPKAIPFILVNELCERFCFYGMRGILSLYLIDQLKYSENMSSTIFHAFVACCFFFCILGAILSDSFLGKFRTILILSIVYAAGCVIITLGSSAKVLTFNRFGTFLGLFVIALGSGGIKPNVAAFGGDQFKLPEQKKQMERFFTIFYFSINVGSAASCIVTPLLKNKVSCMGMKSCYPLAFAVPAILMICAVVIFIMGSPFYKHVPSQSHTLPQIIKCIRSALKFQRIERKTAPKDHWLEYAEKEHSKLRIMETKILLRILVLFLPLPIFWGCYEQLGSTWIFQGLQMNPKVWFMEITSEQMISLNAFLVLMLIPISNVIIFPFLELFRVKSPLQHMAIGMSFTGLSFIMAGLLEHLIATQPAKSINILWQIPQYVIMTLGEILFSITGLKFAYSEAPSSLKSTLSGCWLLTPAIGNGVVAILQSLNLFDLAENEFYFYAALIFTNVVIFSFLAYRYVPIPLEEKLKIEQDHAE